MLDSNAIFGLFFSKVGISQSSKIPYCFRCFQRCGCTFNAAAATVGMNEASRDMVAFTRERAHEPPPPSRAMMMTVVVGTLASLGANTPPPKPNLPPKLLLKSMPPDENRFWAARKSSKLIFGYVSHVPAIQRRTTQNVPS